MTQSLRYTDLLIAPPGIPDARFHSSVIMLTHEIHDSHFGLCVNRPSGYGLVEVLEDTPIKIHNCPDLPVYWGGPVSTTTMWMLHSRDWACEHTVELSEEWAMTSNEAMFHHLSDYDGPRSFRLFMGYCSWAGSQLRNELEGLGQWRKEQSWLLARNQGPEWLFEQPEHELWKNMIALSAHQAVDRWL